MENNKKTNINERLETLKEMVLLVLERVPHTRNSDISLTLNVWHQFYREYLFQDENDKWCVKLETISELPREDNIKRARAIIQNEDGLFLPTDEAVAIARHWAAEDWKEALGYGIKPKGQGTLL